MVMGFEVLMSGCITAQAMKDAVDLGGKRARSKPRIKEGLRLCHCPLVGRQTQPNNSGIIKDPESAEDFGSA